MKKHLYLMPVLALSLATFALAGCDDKQEDEAAAPTATEETVAESAMPTPTDAPAADAVQATITATDAVAYATATGATTGAVFVTLTNPQATADTLTGATADVAERVEIHQTTTTTDGTTSMTSVPSVEIPAGGYVRLEPTSYHLMLINLNTPLTEGQTFNTTLTFTNAGSVTVPVTVVAAGDAATAAPEGQTDATVPVDETPVTEETSGTTTTDEAPAAAADTTTAPAEETTAPAESTSDTTAE